MSTESSEIPNRFPNGVPFICDITNPNLIDQEVFIIGKVISFKNNSLYIKPTSEGNSKEIHIENFQGDVPQSNFIAILGRVLSSDTIEYIESFSEGFEEFELFDKIPKYMKIYNTKKDTTSLFA